MINKMKGVKKCYGLLLALFIMLGLSLSVCSVDTNAYKYDITVLPLNYPLPVSTGGPNYNTFTISHSDDLDPSSYLVSNNLKYFSNPISYSDNPSPCNYDIQDSLPVWYTSNDHYIVGFGFSGFSSGQALPSSWQIPSCLSNLDSRVSWSGIYAQDLDTDNGLHVQTKFSLDSIFGVGNFPNQLYSLTLPLGTPSSSVLSNLSTSTAFDVQGEFVLDFDDPPNSGLSQSSIAHVYVDYIHSDGSYESIPTGICSTSVGRDEPSNSDSVWHLKYNCSLSLDSLYYDSSTLPFFKISVSFEYLNNSTKLYSFIYDSSIIVTDHDDSIPPDDWGDQHVYGSNSDQAPGSAKQNLFPDVVTDGINWTTSLTKLFGFDFLNPFTPIFSLFSDQNQCASIPTLSGMLHSESDQICPWFDSTTRNIVTPVLSIASVMLIFGFAVRWLGASSGNMFEDSDSHVWGNTTFKQKGGK